MLPILNMAIPVAVCDSIKMEPFIMDGILMFHLPIHTTRN